MNPKLLNKLLSIIDRSFSYVDRGEHVIIYIGPIEIGHYHKTTPQSINNIKGHIRYMWVVYGKCKYYFKPLTGLTLTDEQVSILEPYIIDKTINYLKTLINMPEN